MSAKLERVNADISGLRDGCRRAGQRRPNNDVHRAITPANRYTGVRRPRGFRSNTRAVEKIHDASNWVIASRRASPQPVGAPLDRGSRASHGSVPTTVLEAPMPFFAVLPLALIALLAYAATRPNTFRVQRSLRIAAPPQVIAS